MRHLRTMLMSLGIVAAISCVGKNPPGEEQFNKNPSKPSPDVVLSHQGLEGQDDTVAITDYEPSDTGFSLTPLSTIKVRLGVPRAAGSKLEDFDLSNYPISDDTRQLAMKHKVILGDVYPDGRFANLETKKNLSGGCYSVAYDNQAEIFFLDSEFPVEHFLAINQDPLQILVSGQVCLFENGRIKSFDNNGKLFLSGAGVDNFLAVLVSRGFELSDQAGWDEENLSLVKFSLPKFIKRIIHRVPRKVKDAAPNQKIDPNIVQVGVPSSAPRTGFSIDRLPTQKFESTTLVPELGSIMKHEASPFNGPVYQVNMHGNPDVQLYAKPVSQVYYPPQGYYHSDPNLRIAQDLNYISGQGGILNISPGAYQASWGKTQGGYASYKIGPQLGDGTYGSVRKVDVHLENGEKSAFAVKVFKKNDVDFSSAEFRSKIEVLNEFGNHVNFPRFYGTLQDGSGHKGFVMELGQEDLFGMFFESERTITRGEYSNVVHDIVDGFGFLHAKSKVHWDFKLENALVGVDGRVKITDLDDVSLAPNIGGGEPAKTMTVEYAAPERLSRLTGVKSDFGNFDWRESDVYSVGVAMLEMRHLKTFDAIYEDVMGTPWNRYSAGSLLSIQDGSFHNRLINDARYHHPDIPESDIVMWMLHVDPRSRPNIFQVKNALNTVFPRP